MLGISKGIGISNFREFPVLKLFMSGISMGKVRNWLNWFYFLILEDSLLSVWIDSMTFLSLFVDVTTMSMSTVFFLTQLEPGILYL